MREPMVRGPVHHRRFGLPPVIGSKGSRISGSSFSGLFTRVEIGHIGIRSAGAHVKDVLSILRWCENPRDRVAGFRAVRADEVIE